jgi:hypothetical protein
MLEAVNSVLQTAPLARGNIEQASTSRSFAVNPEKVQEIPKAPFITNYIAVDNDFDTAVIQIRDNDTGEVLGQIPSDAKLQAQLQAQRDAQSFEEIRSQINSGVSESSTASPQDVSAQNAGDISVSSTAVSTQQLDAFQSAAQAATAGNGANVSVFA